MSLEDLDTEEDAEEEALGKAYDSRLLRRLWHYVAPYRWQVAVTLLMVAPLFAIELAPAQSGGPCDEHPLRLDPSAVGTPPATSF